MVWRNLSCYHSISKTPPVLVNWRWMNRMGLCRYWCWRNIISRTTTPTNILCEKSRVVVGGRVGEREKMALASIAQSPHSSSFTAKPQRTTPVICKSRKKPEWDVRSHHRFSLIAVLTLVGNHSRFEQIKVDAKAASTIPLERLINSHKERETQFIRSKDSIMLSSLSLKNNRLLHHGREDEPPSVHSTSKNDAPLRDRERASVNFSVFQEWKQSRGLWFGNWKLSHEPSAWLQFEKCWRQQLRSSETSCSLQTITQGHHHPPLDPSCGDASMQTIRSHFASIGRVPFGAAEVDATIDPACVWRVDIGGANDVESWVLQDHPDPSMDALLESLTKLMTSLAEFVQQVRSFDSNRPIRCSKRAWMQRRGARCSNWKSKWKRWNRALVFAIKWGMLSAVPIYVVTRIWWTSSGIGRQCQKRSIQTSNPSRRYWTIPRVCTSAWTLSWMNWRVRASSTLFVIFFWWNRNAESQ